MYVSAKNPIPIVSVMDSDLNEVSTAAKPKRVNKKRKANTSKGKNGAATSHLESDDTEAVTMDDSVGRPNKRNKQSPAPADEEVEDGDTFMPAAAEASAASNSTKKRKATKETKRTLPAGSPRKQKSIVAVDDIELQQGWHVYRDDGSQFWDAVLVKYVLGFPYNKLHNRYWVLQLVESDAVNSVGHHQYKVSERWGVINSTGRSRLFEYLYGGLDEGKKVFSRLFRRRSGRSWLKPDRINHKADKYGLITRADLTPSELGCAYTVSVAFAVSPAQQAASVALTPAVSDNKREAATVNFFAKWYSFDEARRREQTSSHPILALLKKPAEMDHILPLLKLDTPVWPLTGLSWIVDAPGRPRMISLLQFILHNVNPYSHKERLTHAAMIQLAINNVQKYGYDFSRVPAANKALASVDGEPFENIDSMLLLAITKYHGNSRVLELLLSLPNVSPAMLNARHTRPTWYHYHGRLSLVDEFVSRNKMNLVTRALQVGAAVCVEPWSVKEMLEWDVEFLLQWLCLLLDHGRLNELRLKPNWQSELASHGFGNRIWFHNSHQWRKINTDTLIKHIVLDKLANWLEANPRNAVESHHTSPKSLFSRAASWVKRVVSRTAAAASAYTSYSAFVTLLSRTDAALQRAFLVSNVLAAMPHMPVLRSRLSSLQPEADIAAPEFNMRAWLSNVQAQLPELLYSSRLLKEYHPSNLSSALWKQVFALHRNSGRHIYLAEDGGVLLAYLKRDVVKAAMTPDDVRLLVAQLEQLRGAELLSWMSGTLWSSSIIDPILQPLSDVLSRAVQQSQSGQLDLANLLPPAGTFSQSDARVLASQVLSAIKH